MRSTSTSGIATHLDEPCEAAVEKAIKKYRIPKALICSANVVKRSVDARKKEDIHFYSAFILPRQIFYGWRRWETVKTEFFQILAEISSDVISELFSGN